MSPTGLNSTRLLLEDVAKCMGTLKSIQLCFEVIGLLFLGTEPSRPTYIQRVGRAIVSLPLPVSVLHFLNANLAEEREKDCSNSVLAMLGDFK